MDVSVSTIFDIGSFGALSLNVSTFGTLTGSETQSRRPVQGFEKLGEYQFMSPIAARHQSAEKLTFPPRDAQLSPSSVLVTSCVHSPTLPCISKRPKAFGSFCPTGCALEQSSLNHATRSKFSSVISVPSTNLQKSPVEPARHAVSHSSFVGSRKDNRSFITRGSELSR